MQNAAVGCVIEKLGPPVLFQSGARLGQTVRILTGKDEGPLTINPFVFTRLINTI